MAETAKEQLHLSISSKGWVILHNEEVAQKYEGSPNEQPAESRTPISSRVEALDAIVEGLTTFRTLNLPEKNSHGEPIKYFLIIETKYAGIAKNLLKTADKTSSNQDKYLGIKEAKDKCNAVILVETTDSPFADKYLSLTGSKVEDSSVLSYISEGTE